METYVVLAYRWGGLDNHCYLVAVCDSQFIAQRYADNETASRGGKYACFVYKKLMNAPFTDTDVIVYQTKSQKQK
jgi:hypothetical protein